MASKNIIIKKKIGNDIFELLPKTTGDQVEVTYASQVQSLAAALATVYTDLASWNTFKASVDFAGTDSALDTLREIIDTLSDETTAGTIAKAISDLEDAIGTDSTVGTVKYRIKTIEDSLGDTANPAAGTINKQLDDLQAYVGDDTTNGTLGKRVTDLEGTVGDSSTAGTLVKRVDDLETASGTLAHIIFVDKNSSIPSTVTANDLILQEMADPTP